MPRPDSKIMQTAASFDGGEASGDSNAETLVSKSRAKRVAVQSAVTDVTAKPVKLSAEDKAAAKQAAADAKAAEKAAAVQKAADLKQKKANLAEILKQAHAPLNGVTNDLKANTKAKAAAIAAHAKALAAFDKTEAVLTAKQAKYAAAFEKTETKINAQLAKLA